MGRTLLVALALACSASVFAPAERVAGQQTDTLDVFFLGNSYIYYNTLPELVSGISSAMESGPFVRTGHHLHGGYSLRRHLDDCDVRDEIGVGVDGTPHDYVVVQEHSRLGVPYADEGGTLGDPGPFREAAAEVVGIVRELGAQPLFYMTWAKEAYPNQSDALADAYVSAGNTLGVPVAPVGLAWARVRAEHPDIVLFHPDGSHPSPAGSYLAACVFYAVLTGTSPVGAPAELWGTEIVTPGVAVGNEPIPLVRLTPDAASRLQQVAWEVAQNYIAGR